MYVGFLQTDWWKEGAQNAATAWVFDSRRAATVVMTWTYVDRVIWLCIIFNLDHHWSIVVSPDKIHNRRRA